MLIEYHIDQDVLDEALAVAEEAGVTQRQIEWLLVEYALPQLRREQVRGAIETFKVRLRAAGYGQGSRNSIAYQVRKALLGEPGSDKTLRKYALKLWAKHMPEHPAPDAD